MSDTERAVTNLDTIYTRCRTLVDRIKEVISTPEAAPQPGGAPYGVALNTMLRDLERLLNNSIPATEEDRKLEFMVCFLSRIHRSAFRDYAFHIRRACLLLLLDVNSVGSVLHTEGVLSIQTDEGGRYHLEPVANPDVRNLAVRQAVAASSSATASTGANSRDQPRQPPGPGNGLRDQRGPVNNRAPANEPRPRGRVPPRVEAAAAREIRRGREAEKRNEKARVREERLAAKKAEKAAQQARQASAGQASAGQASAGQQANRAAPKPTLTLEQQQAILAGDTLDEPAIAATPSSSATSATTSSTTEDAPATSGRSGSYLAAAIRGQSDAAEPTANEHAPPPADTPSPSSVSAPVEAAARAEPNEPKANGHPASDPAGGQTQVKPEAQDASAAAVESAANGVASAIIEEKPKPVLSPKAKGKPAAKPAPAKKIAPKNPAAKSKPVTTSTDTVATPASAATATSPRAVPTKVEASSWADAAEADDAAKK